jgi:hypothetical protein
VLCALATSLGSTLPGGAIVVMTRQICLELCPVSVRRFVCFVDWGTQDCVARTQGFYNVIWRSVFSAPSHWLIPMSSYRPSFVAVIILLLAWPARLAECSRECFPQLRQVSDILTAVCNDLRIDRTTFKNTVVAAFLGIKPAASLLFDPRPMFLLCCCCCCGGGGGGGGGGG